MQDKDVLEHIEKLVDEEHRLMRRSEDGQAAGGDHERMRELQVSLDRAWDLLRQRRAMRDRGEDPNDAAERPPSIVEHYEQ
jgi:hypothetical protein